MDIYFSLDKDGLTGGLQLSIEDDVGGYRIAGPKYCGHSKNLQRKKIDAHDAKEIRAYLDKAFPLTTQGPAELKLSSHLPCGCPVVAAAIDLCPDCRRAEEEEYEDAALKAEAGS